ncbi:MAG: hypothetical protein ACE5JL_05315 [Dehalococcoidia bacterium]
MNVGFLMFRTTFLKTMGPLIDRCLGDGHNVAIFYDGDPKFKLGQKGYQAFTPEQVPDFPAGRPELVECAAGSLANLCREQGIDVLVTHEGYHFCKSYGYLGALSQLRKAGTQAVSLSHFYEIAMRPLAALDHFDKTYYVSDYARELHLRTQPGPRPNTEVLKELAKKQEVASSSLFDLVNRASPEEARERLGVAPDQKVVLVLAPTVNRDLWHTIMWSNRSRLKRSVAAVRARRLRYLWEVWFGVAYEPMAKAIKGFCKRNDALLVVKARKKQTDPGPMVREADIFLDGSDDEYYPVFTTHLLLSIASLCVSWGSFGTLESAVAGVPVLNILVPPLDWEGITFIDRRWGEILNVADERHPFNYPGCVFGVDRRRIVKFLRDKALHDFKMDQNARQSYLQEYVGITNQTSSERILRSMVELVAGRNDRAEIAAVEAERGVPGETSARS